MVERAIKSTCSLRALEILTLVISVVISLTVSEMVLRLFVDAPLTRLYPQVKYDPHPIRRFTLHPDQQAYTYGKVQINGVGFARMESQPTDKPKFEFLHLAIHLLLEWVFRITKPGQRN